MSQFAPFDVATVIAQIQAQVPTLRFVGGAADYAAIKSLREFQPPCAFVLLAKEKAQYHQGGGQQRSIITFGVVMAVRNYRAADRGLQGSDALRGVLDSVRGALMTWTPPVKGGRPCQLQQGDLVDYDGANLLWTDTYQTQAILQP